MKLLLLVSFLTTLIQAHEEADQSARDLIGRLRSEKLEEREDAARKLADLGSSARPELDRASRDSDPEIRGRVKQVVEEMDRRKRILGVRPAPIRLTPELKDEPLSEAVLKLLNPFGLRGAVDGNDLATRRISVALKEATLWEVLQALRAKANITFDVGNICEERLDFEEERPSRKGRPFVDHGDTRVFLDLRMTRASEDRSAGMLVMVSVALPVGSSPRAGTVEQPRLVDQQGRNLVLEQSREPGYTYASSEDGQGMLLSRKPGRLTYDTIWIRWIPLVALRDVKTIRYEGKIVLSYPHDLARVEFDLTDPKATLTKTYDDLNITIKDLQIKPNRISYNWEYGDLVKGKRRTALGWVEDTEGRWLGDDGAMVDRAGSPGGTGGGTGGVGLAENTKPGKIIFAQFIGEDKVVATFTFKDVPIPKGSEK